MSRAKLPAMFKFLRTRREDAEPPVPIAAVRDGERVKIVGRVAAIRRLTSPCTSRACVAYQARLISGTDSVDLSEVTSFAVFDGTERALVSANEKHHVDLDLEVDQTRTLMARSREARDIAVIRALGWDRPIDHLAAVIFDEAALAPDGIVAVWGTATREVVPIAPTTATMYRESANTIIRITRSRDAPLRISNRSRATRATG